MTSGDKWENYFDNYFGRCFGRWEIFFWQVGIYKKITRREILFTDSQIQSLDADWSSPNDPAISSYIKKFSEFYSAKMYVCIYDTYDIIYSGKQIKKISFFNF